ncbi:MAG: carboxypeptidase regulatory-like domain-containing protein, partial [Pyrinomonadaceae bacterium]|nr:carboxypeptidase regulatory-like domain-containing protein [Pyrinomonadaceae bacterium]
MKLRNTIALISFMLLLFTSQASAQTYRGTIRGTITDPRGAVISGATIKLISEETNETRTAMSGADGEYTLFSLRPGRYSLQVEAAGLGFDAFQQEVVLQVNQEIRVDASLSVGTRNVAIEVINDPPSPLKQDTASLGTVIENRQVTGLPLDGRNFFELNLLVPGAVPAAQGSAGSVRGDFAFSVNGAREDSNNFLLDGVYNVDPKLNTFAVRPPVDAIREFEVATSTY